MAYKPGTSAAFAKLGENGINIRMITQGPEELNIIVGVDGGDFERAIRVLYDSRNKEEPNYERCHSGRHRCGGP